VDSIQTMRADGLAGSPGSIGQVRACAGELLRVAKETTASVFLVGHITKAGALAGPKVLEHMVDTVLYLEGERRYPYRLLRVAKNRFGSTDELAMFAMEETGLVEVANPSAVFLADRGPGRTRHDRLTGPRGHAGASPGVAGARGGLGLWHAQAARDRPGL